MLVKRAKWRTYRKTIYYIFSLLLLINRHIVSGVYHCSILRYKQIIHNTPLQDFLGCNDVTFYTNDAEWGARNKYWVFRANLNSAIALVEQGQNRNKTTGLTNGFDLLGL